MSNEELAQKLDALIAQTKESAEEQRRIFRSVQQTEYEDYSTDRYDQTEGEPVREGDSGAWALAQVAYLKTIGYGEPQPQERVFGSADNVLL